MYSWRGEKKKKKSVKARIFDFKIGRHDPGELAKMIKSKHNIEKLIENKIILADPAMHFEMATGPNALPQPKQEEYLKENPVDIDGIGYKNTSYFRVQQQEKIDRERHLLAISSKQNRSLESFSIEE